jgi:SAM-dependent methyltransferase
LDALGRFRDPPGVGHVDLGSFRRPEPISRRFGYDRGQPIDRFFIERFLDQQAGDVRGRVLEVADDTYTRRYGGGRVQRADVLHVHEGHPEATIVGDLAHGDDLPSNAFDCIILTQTLHLIFDVHAAVRTVHRMLRPGGVLLLTVPGISQVGLDEFEETWCWSMTAYAVRRLLGEVFPASSLTVDAYGNALAAVGFLEGLCVDDLKPHDLEASDPQYPLLVTARAVKG